MEKISKKAIYLFDDTDTVEITAKGMRGRRNATDIRASKHEIIENVPAPALWKAHLLKYTVSGGWVPDVDFADEYNAAKVPESITAHQAKTALHRKDPSLNGAIKSMLSQPGNEEAKLAWEDRNEFRRDSPFIATLAAAVPLTDSELDDLFIVGGEIE